MGEPAGIGGEIALKVWLGRDENLPPFVALDDPHRLETEAERLGIAVPVCVVDGIERVADTFGDALPVLPLPLAVAVTPGRPDVRNAAVVQQSIERAVALALDGRVGAVVTNPIHKGTLLSAGFPYAGHTEFLAELAGLAPSEAIMMLASPILRVVPVTVHQSLFEATRSLTAERIVHACVVTDGALRRQFRIDRPRLTVTGLNPHAGEEGKLGNEEIEIIAPAVETVREKGIDVRGPLPADTLFCPGARSRFDVAICMYHDQALIPIKTLDFDRAVNTTLGLPFIRTSPDHGTALDIAGKGVANEANLVAAFMLAADMASDARVTAG